ncbi:hypothetical protein KQX54_018392 [Cotesia glomerata]|uniref:Gustatory receptor n=1 Tax=Cotesia glomerata TaxID=32391 RepID=A0AAV7J080_COTGL|nr:hypothetical protein KQX54_018392 [Cotesia glomerata]
MELYEMCYNAAYFYGIPIIIVILCCGNRKLARTICSLVDQSTLDDKVVEKLSCFSSELSELEIVLTACDIIPLNRSLLGIVSKIQFLIHPIEYAPVSFYIMLLSRQRVL